MKLEKTFAQFVVEIKAQIKTAQYRALQTVNNEQINLYWNIGKTIVERQALNNWGKSIVEMLAIELQKEFVGINGFSARNLWYMRNLYEQYSDSTLILQPVVAEIPWTHNILILEKCKSEQERYYYIKMTAAHGWSKTMLVNAIGTQSFQNTLLNQHNFEQTSDQESLLTEDDLEQIRNNDELRLEVIDKGISKGNTKSKRQFGGRYIIPYDKGGESDAEGGWMPNYYVPTNYFIDWSEWAMKRMKTFTIAERIRVYGEGTKIISSYENTTCAVFRNTDRYFKFGITYSPTGIYSPTFREGCGANFGNKGSSIFSSKNSFQLIGILNSFIYKYLLKNYRAHTVESPEEGLLDTSVIIIPLKTEILVKSIIKKQKDNSRYDYASYEQIEIDKLVYEAYGLNAEDVQEVENWYARRYAKLSAAQKANLRALGKSDDYLELYGLRKKQDA